MSSTKTPEEKYHGRKQFSNENTIRTELTKPKLYGRITRFLNTKIFLINDNHLHEFLYRHGQRSNIQRYMCMFLFSYYLGTLASYYNYKRNVVEDKWVENYGQDVPHYRKWWLSSTIQRIRAEYIHFYRYRLFYFIEEQVIDPLNDNSLSGKAFEVYQFKRLIRALKYDDIRDDSFDFLQIGDDDMEDFDDFV